MQRNILHTFATKRLRQIQSICAVAAITLGSLLTGPARVAYAEIPDANTCKNPRLAAVVVRPGDPLAVNSEMAFTNTVYTIPYSGTVSAGQCTALQTGAVWGLAFEPSSRNLYMSAAMIAGAGFGTLGSGGIYRSEEGKPTSTDAFADLDALGFATRPANFPASNAARGLTGNPKDSWEGAINQIVLDNQRAQVGRMGLGDIDVSPDGKTLWTVNLFSRSLISITRAGDNSKPTAADIKSIAIPAPAENGTPICIRDEFRPWALEVTDNSVYVGVTCSDENHVGAEPGEDVNDNLRGLIYQYNIAGNSWSLLSITSDNQAKPYFQLKGYRWDHPNPNNNAYNRQLFLADLELDDDGSIVVGMADRWPMMGSNTLDRHSPTLGKGRSAAHLQCGKYAHAGEQTAPAMVAGKAKTTNIITTNPAIPISKPIIRKIRPAASHCYPAPVARLYPCPTTQSIRVARAIAAATRFSAIRVARWYTR